MGYIQEREQWFVFRSERLRVFMEAWLAAHAFKPIPRPAYTPEVPPVKPTPVPPSQDQLALRRGRGLDTLRKQLRDIAENLGGRDWKKSLLLLNSSRLDEPRDHLQFAPRTVASKPKLMKWRAHRWHRKLRMIWRAGRRV